MNVAPQHQPDPAEAPAGDPADSASARPADSSRTPAPEATSPAGSAKAVGTDEAAGSDAAAGSSAQPQSWSDIAPWQGRATWVDKMLLAGVIGLPIFYLALLPFRPQLVVSHPVLLEFLTGAKTAIVGAGAFAGVGEIPVWLVLLAGWIGMVKFDWLFWLAGRRWGDGAVNLFVQSDRQRRRFQKLRELPSWLLFIFVLISRVPGIPSSIVWLVAGYSRMKLWLFLTAELTGGAIMAAIWTALGYRLGQRAVDVLTVIDKYALWVTLAIIVGIVVWTSVKSARSNGTAGRTPR